MTNTAIRGMGAMAKYAPARAAGGRQEEFVGNFADVFGKAAGQQQMAFQGGSLVSGSSKLTVSQGDKKGLDSSQLSETNGRSAEKQKSLDETAQLEMDRAGEKLVTQISNELGVTEEEVAEAMEALGLTVSDLLNADKLTQLVLVLKGADTLSLMTDEGLYHSLQNLLGGLTEVQNNLAAELGVTPEELSALMEQLKPWDNRKGADLQAQFSEAGADLLSEGQEDYSVTVEQDGEMVRVSVEVDGNAKTETAEVTAQAPAKEESMSRNKEGRGRGDGFMQGNDSRTGLVPENPLNNEATVRPEGGFENAFLARTVSTQDIMNQIMEYMRVHIKADLTQMEIQLHPASLGTININISSKEGLITAQFLTQNEMVRAAVESQLVQLKNSFEEQGIKVEAVEVAVGTHEFERNLSGESGSQQQFQGEKKKGIRKLNLNELSPEDEAQLDEEEQIAVAMMSAGGNTVDFTA